MSQQALAQSQRLIQTQLIGATPLFATMTHYAVYRRYRYLSRYLEEEKQAGRAHPKLTREWDVLRAGVLRMAVPIVGKNGVLMDQGLDPKERYKQKAIQKAIAWADKHDPHKKIRRMLERKKERFLNSREYRNTCLCSIYAATHPPHPQQGRPDEHGCDEVAKT